MTDPTKKNGKKKKRGFLECWMDLNHWERHCLASFLRSAFLFSKIEVHNNNNNGLKKQHTPEGNPPNQNTVNKN
jgi:hypothetical protein